MTGTLKLLLQAPGPPSEAASGRCSLLWPQAKKVEATPERAEAGLLEHRVCQKPHAAFV